MTSLLDFYQQHNISPVRQNITDLSAHYARRAKLYRDLGLPPMAVSGKSVLEIGPGAGENALYTESLKPSSYEYVEPNVVAARQLNERLCGHRIGWPVWAWLESIHTDPIEELDLGRGFDLVLCEGLLGLCGTDPKVLLEHVVTHVAPGGVLVLTCIDAISDHAEVLRRAMAQQLIDRSVPLMDQVDILRPVFAPHLATLKGMTRSVDDWIIDNLLNPASIGPTFSIPEALEALEGRFAVLGCSPRFLMDWRWYKDADQSNAWAVKSYWEQCHNLIDYRTIESPRSEALNRSLMDECLSFRAAVRAYERGEGEAPDQDLSDIGWFGRGQQYLSFVRL